MKLIISLIFAGVLTGISSAVEAAPKDEQIKVAQAVEKIAAGAQLLDVRTKEEWDDGHLKGAKLVTLSDKGFAEKVKAVFDPKKPLVVYCGSGNRSAKATKHLRDGGFTSVFDMAGGIYIWEKEGNPIVKDPAPANPNR